VSTRQKGDGFGSRDPDYLRDVQYRDPAKLTARADLHTKYRTARVPWFSWVVAQIDWTVSKDILEVGCGPGWLWAEAAPELPDDLRLTLTDLSPGMVEAAVERIGGIGSIEVIDAQVADAQELPFDDDAFDLVIANHMLYHVTMPDVAVREFARVVRPYGVLMTATIGPRHLPELWEIRAEVFGGEPKSHNPDVFGSVTGLPILRRYFSDVEWHEYLDTLRCTDPDDVVAFLTSAPPGEDASAQQLADLRRAVQSRFGAGKGVLTVCKETGVFLARGPLTSRR
jgi:ubiquinone/menaquinone biosynthesis C-methylase UbiE